MAYIERDIFINNELIPLVKTLDLCHPKQKKGVLMAISKLKDTPAADVAEVRHGKWIKTYPDNKLDGNYYCSNCKNGIDIATGEETPIDRELYYCPCCGAKLDGENE